MIKEFDKVPQEELEAALDEFVSDIQEDVLKDMSVTTVVNPTRLRQLLFCYAVCKFITRHCDAKVTYKLYQPFKTMGSVSIEDKHLDFYEVKWFTRAAEFADNTEVYPLANGNVKLTFTFHNLTVAA